MPGVFGYKYMSKDCMVLDAYVWEVPDEADVTYYLLKGDIMGMNKAYIPLNDRLSKAVKVVSDKCTAGVSPSILSSAMILVPESEKSRLFEKQIKPGIFMVAQRIVNEMFSWFEYGNWDFAEVEKLVKEYENLSTLQDLLNFDAKFRCFPVAGGVEISEADRLMIAAHAAKMRETILKAYEPIFGKEGAATALKSDEADIQKRAKEKVLGKAPVAGKPAAATADKPAVDAETRAKEAQAAKEAALA